MDPPLKAMSETTFSARHKCCSVLGRDIMCILLRIPWRYFLFSSFQQPAEFSSDFIIFRIRSYYFISSEVIFLLKISEVISEKRFKYLVKISAPSRSRKFLIKVA